MTNTRDLQLDALLNGDRRVLPDLFQSYRTRLRQMVRLRIGPQLAARVDPSDVLQEAFIEAQRRVDEFIAEPKVSFFIWLRGLVFNRMRKTQRAHLGTQLRSVDREKELDLPEAASLAIVNSLTSPSQKVARTELRQIIEQSIQKLKEMDREIILMRYFEGLSNTDVAQALDISESTSTMRHVRAIQRLKDLLLSRLGSENFS